MKSGAFFAKLKKILRKEASQRLIGIDEAMILVSEHNDKEDNDDDQIYVHKFELVD